MSDVAELVAAYQCGEYVPVAIPDLIAAAAQACEVCFGDGLVCEEHPLRPWETGSAADCDCGAPGMPCVCTGLQHD